MTESESDRPAGNGRGPGGPSSFFAELKERRVFRAAAAYAVVAWGATEILDGVVSRLGWPEWIATLVVIVFVVGFPVAMFLAWAFDWTKAGIRRAEPWTARGWLSIALALAFLVLGSAGLFWLINPSGVARVEQVGVAVLPCRYRGPPEFSFRGEGFAEIVHGDLARFPGLFVPDFGAVVRTAQTNLPTAELGAMLGVTWLVECRVVGENDRIRVEARLVDTASDQGAALDSVDASALEIVGALDAVGAAVLDRFGISGGSRPGRAARYPPSLRVLDAYLKGQQAMRRGDPVAAREAFRQAQVVSGFDLARVREADAMMAMADSAPGGGGPSAETLLKAVDLLLDELGAQPHPPAEVYIARLRHADLMDRLATDAAPAEDARRGWFEQAVARDPNAADAYRLFADYLAETGKPDEAAGHAETAARLTPGPGGG